MLQVQTITPRVLWFYYAVIALAFFSNLFALLSNNSLKCPLFIDVYLIFLKTTTKSSILFEKPLLSHFILTSPHTQSIIKPHCFYLSMDTEPNHLSPARAPPFENRPSSGHTGTSTRVSSLVFLLPVGLAQKSLLHIEDNAFLVKCKLGQVTTQIKVLQRHLCHLH